MEDLEKVLKSYGWFVWREWSYRSVIVLLPFSPELYLIYLPYYWKYEPILCWINRLKSFAQYVTHFTVRLFGFFYNVKAILHFDKQLKLYLWFCVSEFCADKWRGCVSSVTRTRCWPDPVLWRSCVYDSCVTWGHCSWGNALFKIVHSLARKWWRKPSQAVCYTAP